MSFCSLKIFPPSSPRQGEPGDEVRLRGPRALVTKLKTELEKISANLKDRVILGVSIPASHHRTLIGRGGQHLNQLQDRTNTTIYFPGSRSYNQVGEVENTAELGEGNSQDLVKVIGPKDACEKAIKELKVFLGCPVLCPLSLIKNISRLRNLSSRSRRRSRSPPSTSMPSANRATSSGASETTA